MRADIHDGREPKRSNQRPDTLMQDRIRQIDEIPCTTRPDHTSGSKAEELNVSITSPLIPRKRPSSGHWPTSQTCHKATYAVQQAREIIRSPRQPGPGGRVAPLCRATLRSAG